MERIDAPPYLNEPPGSTSFPPVAAARPFEWPEFFLRFAHEFRTPLQVVLGYSELLGADALAPEQREAVEAIQYAGRHLLELVADSLDLGLSESRHRALHVEAVDCSRLLTDVELQVRPLAASKDMLIVVETACASVLADRRRLVQVLFNLLSNAVKFSPEGGRIVLSCAAPERGHVRFEVRDSGPGVSTEGLARIFRPFERLAPDVPGTGLGLAICRSLIDEMGGTLGATSSVGLGSTFWFELPVPNLRAATAPMAHDMRTGRGRLSA